MIHAVLMDRVVREAEEQDFKVWQTTKGGWIFERDGLMVTVSGTPSSARGWQYLKSQLVAAGFVWPW